MDAASWPRRNASLATSSQDPPVRRWGGGGIVLPTLLTNSEFESEQDWVIQAMLFMVDGQ